MRSGKIPETVLKRSVIKLIDYKNKAVKLGAGIGRDCSVIDAGDRYILTSTECALTGRKMSPYYAVIRAANNVWACGGTPVSASAAFVLSEDFDESRLKGLTRMVVSGCRECRIELSGGHTEITKGAVYDMVTVTVTGLCNKEDFRNIKAAAPGMDIVATKHIALEETALLLDEHMPELLLRLPESYVRGVRVEGMCCVGKEASAALKNGAVAMHDVADGGIFAALWDLAEGAGTGITVNLKDIPVMQETIEFCEVFDLNPYQMPSSGCLLIITEDGAAMVDALAKEGVEAAVIGCTTDSNDKKVINGDEIRYLDKP